MEGFVLIEITISRVHSRRMIYLSLSFSFLLLPIQKNSFPLLPQFLTFLLPNHPSSSSSTDICPISIQQLDADRSSFESQSVERVKLINETRAVLYVHASEISPSAATIEQTIPTERTCSNSNPPPFPHLFYSRKTKESLNSSYKTCFSRIIHPPASRILTSKLLFVAQD